MAPEETQAHHQTHWVYQPETRYFLSSSKEKFTLVLVYWNVNNMDNWPKSLKLFHITSFIFCHVNILKDVTDEF